MAIRPLNNYVFIKVEEADTKSAGGIILQKEETLPDTGRVMFANNLALVNETVKFRQYSAIKATVDGDQYAVIKEEELLGILD